MNEKSQEDIAKQILELKHEKNVLILAHNYQILAVQEIADFVGDSLELSQKAMEARKPIIVFCGVRFMAEVAKILNPGAKVLMPRGDAGCPMADMVTPEDIDELRKQHPDAAVCSYINTNADVKAVSDVCCTSSNASKVVARLESEKVIFAPDRNLAAYVQRGVGKQIIPCNGYCYVHTRFTVSDVESARKAHPKAIIIVHPECDPDVIGLADEVLSTSGMLRFARSTNAQEIVVGTEEGLIERMRKEIPEKRFFSLGRAQICSNMKRTRLEDVLVALQDEVDEIRLDDATIEAARKPLERMFALIR